MKRYFAFLVCGLFLFPSVLFAEEGDTLGLQQSLLYNNKIGSSDLVGLSSYKAKKPKKPGFQALRFSGQVRFYPFYRNMQNYYSPPQTAQGLTLPINLTADDGYQQPLILLRMEGAPGKTWFQTEFQFNHFLKRTTSLTTDTMGRIANLYVIFQFTAGVDTKIGNLKMIAGGGVNWYRLSPFTLWQYQYRDDMFERYPWEPEGHDFSRYNSYYSMGDIPRDQRFGMQATQGFILQGTNMPAGFDAVVLYGKTNNSGGFQSYLTKNPLNMLGGRIGKKVGENNKIGYNYFNQYGYDNNTIVSTPVKTDASGTYYVETNRQSQLVTTVDGRFEFRKFSIFTELGAGSYLSNSYNAGLKDYNFTIPLIRENAKPGLENVSRFKRDWSETMFFEITTKRNLTYLPLKVAAYRIGDKFVNLNSSVFNTNVERAKASTTVPDNYNINYWEGLLTDVGQLASNRQGINIFTYKDIKKLKIKFDLGMSQEVTNLAGDLRNGARAIYAGVDTANHDAVLPYTNSITFEHRLNSITRSKLAFYERFTGPYNAFHSIFRRSFENLAIIDPVVNYKKSYNTIDLELKYKLSLFGKELILANFNNYSSVQDHFSPIPLFTDKAFLRYFYEEFMAFYGIHQKVTLVGFLGMERALGNKRTEQVNSNGVLITDPLTKRPIADPNGNGKPINQTGYGYGLGIDYNFHSRASLHLRNRWFTFSDKNFILDKFKGYETTMEFKVFF